MTKEEMARKNHERKAKATEIWNMWQESLGLALHIFVSLIIKTTTPADEHAAASDKMPVTCSIMIIFTT